MQIIKSIRIAYFRSFSQKIEIEEINDLNIFSGKNDSGKSNVLKALNLFFSDEKIDFYNYLNFEKDFSKLRAEHATTTKVKKQIEISVLFNRCDFSNSVLPEHFWVEKAWDKDGTLLYRKIKNERGQKIIHKESTSKVDASVTSYLKKIHFFHVPAIKDREYLDFLKKEYQESLLYKIVMDEGADGQIGSKNWIKTASVKQITRLLSDKINQDARDMMESFRLTTNEISESRIDIPQLDYSKVLEITTEKNILLTQRGDGVQAKLIPELLSEIGKNRKASYVIWGFEEPENSYEYANAQLLAEQFVEKYSKKNQIFITTHAFNFLTLKGKNISTYRVWKPNYEEGTQVKCIFSNGEKLLENIPDDLHEELGVFSLNAELQSIYEEKKNELEQYKKIQQELESERKPILLVEDEHNQIYKIAWLKINQKYFDDDNFEQIFDENALFKVVGANGSGNVEGFLRSKTHDILAKKKIVGLFDFDTEGKNKFHSTKNAWNLKDKIQGSKRDGLFMINPSNSNVGCLLLPVPERLDSYACLEYKSCYVEVENLLSDDLLSKLQHVNDEPIAGGLSVKVVDSKSKGTFWKQLLKADKKEFEDFKPLFQQIENILKLKSNSL